MLYSGDEVHVFSTQPIVLFNFGNEIPQPLVTDRREGRVFALWVQVALHKRGGVIVYPQ